VGLLHQVFPTLVVGNARTGKTVLLRYFAAQAALHQVRLILWDVAGGLMGSVAPPGVALARDWVAIEESARCLAGELRLRQEGQVGGGPPVLLVADDWTRQAPSCPCGRRALARLIAAGAQHGLYAAVAGEILDQHCFEPWCGGDEQIVPQRAATRYLFPSTRTAAAAAQLAAVHAQAADLSSGQALLCQTGADVARVSAPLTTAADLISAVADPAARGWSPPAESLLRVSWAGKSVPDRTA